ncbi:hypothetical protein NG796_16760 [Laspinema sp. A4]|uniref:hypothetical protein n=1 Tax=Laspinema sp. D2d TaxID=2953686 RepID=UPI0021BA8A1F|nr:hypothetical protein [Laspinema sp. D2d]MCT7984924.1 hypothetical protein [Laspinema sp. D2d]
MQKLNHTSLPPPMLKPECNSCRYHSHHYALFCTVHSSGPSQETCLDHDPDPNSETRQFQDFLGLGETVNIEAPITNPYHDAPEENWTPDGWQFVGGQLRRVE